MYIPLLYFSRYSPHVLYNILYYVQYISTYAMNTLCNTYTIVCYVASIAYIILSGFFYLYILCYISYILFMHCTTLYYTTHIGAFGSGNGGGSNIARACVSAMEKNVSYMRKITLIFTMHTIISCHVYFILLLLLLWLLLHF